LFKSTQKMKTADTVILIPVLAETLNIKNAQFMFFFSIPWFQ